AANAYVHGRRRGAPIGDPGETQMEAGRQPSAVAAEVARFDALADRWWDPEGPLRPLHRMNPTRVAWIVKRIRERFGEAGGQRVLDVGCGAGACGRPAARSGLSGGGTRGPAGRGRAVRRDYGARGDRARGRSGRLPADFAAAGAAGGGVGAVHAGSQHRVPAHREDRGRVRAPLAAARNARLAEVHPTARTDRRLALGRLAAKQARGDDVRSAVGVVADRAEAGGELHRGGGRLTPSGPAYCGAAPGGGGGMPGAGGG